MLLNVPQLIDLVFNGHMKDSTDSQKSLCFHATVMLHHNFHAWKSLHRSSNNKWYGVVPNLKNKGTKYEIHRTW